MSRYDNELEREWARLGIDPNEMPPDCCPECEGPLESSTGYVGENLVYCPNPKCGRNIVWEDRADAIRRVL